MEQVVRILAGGIEADDELHRTVVLGDAFEPRAEAGRAGGGLGEREFLGGRLKVVPALFGGHANGTIRPVAGVLGG
jgi:hypothetical protein